MSAGWVAGTVRAGALARRRLGTAGVRSLAACPSLAAAIETLVGSPYGRDVHAGATLAAAQRGIAATTLWDLRVLAGWLPPAGVRALRAFAGWFEISNVEEHLRALSGAPAEPPYHLGALATAWPRLAATTSAGDLRAALAASAWWDPGGATAHDIGVAMRLAWWQRVAGQCDAGRAWATGAAALLVARELVAAGRRPPEGAARAAEPLIGRRWAAATTLPALRDSLPGRAQWALRDVDRPSDLWRAEARWWGRLHADGTLLLSGSAFGLRRVAGAVALMAVDAWRTRAALEVAARGGAALEAFDAVA
jgi:hypothetical protein